MADPTNRDAYLDPLNWGTSTGGAAGAAETDATLGIDRKDIAVPRDVYRLSNLSITRMKNLVKAMSEFAKGGTRLKVLKQSANPFGAGESGFYIAQDGTLYAVVDGTPLEIGGGGGGGIAGSGTANAIAKFTDTEEIGDSALIETATNLTLTGRRWRHTNTDDEALCYSTQDVKHVLTEDANPTPIWSLTLNDGDIYSVEATVVGNYTTGGGKRALYTKKALVYKDGGGATLQGSVVSVHADIETTAGWAATFAVSGDDIQLLVTGEAATEIDWSAVVRRLNCVPVIS